MRFIYVLCIAVVFCCGLIGACSGGQCSTDMDCKGERICMGGRCVDPGRSKEDAGLSEAIPDSARDPDQYRYIDLNQETTIDSNLTPEPTSLKVYPGEVKIQASSFVMGSPSGELGRESGEVQHKVTFTNSFMIFKHEVTQGQFKDLMGENPSRFSSCGDDCPVENITWHEALVFCNALSKKRGLPECFDCTGSGQFLRCKLKFSYVGNSGKDYYKCKGYRLPTEAEWEYAYRAGARRAFYSGKITTSTGTDPNLNKIGWYDGNSGKTTHPVGQKEPNAWGLYDMAGNVWEWVYDWYGAYSKQWLTDPVGSTSGHGRVRRGGGCDYAAHYCRASRRSSLSPTSQYFYLGFRVVRSL